MKYGKYFLITLLLVFFMLLYAYVSYKPRYRHESFSEASQWNLWPPETVVNIQGNGVPPEDLKPTQIDMTDPSTQSVDGTPDGPKSMFMFAYNKCDVSCCDKSPYSCTGGCVCLTDDQKKMIQPNNSCAYKV
jgi:hypothetical protein